MKPFHWRLALNQTACKDHRQSTKEIAKTERNPICLYSQANTVHYIHVNYLYPKEK